MAIFNWLTRVFSNNRQNDTNPATGLPMMGNVDTEGNPYGFDLRQCSDRWYREVGQPDQSAQDDTEIFSSSDDVEWSNDIMGVSFDMDDEIFNQSMDSDQFESGFDSMDSADDTWNEPDNDWATQLYDDTINSGYDDSDYPY